MTIPDGKDHVLVVNMIPKSMSGSTAPSGNPEIAVNPANQSQMVSSAYVGTSGWDALGVVSALQSDDGGLTWFASDALPYPSALALSLRFASSGGGLYIAYGHDVATDHALTPTFFDILRRRSSSGVTTETQLFRVGGRWGFPCLDAVTVSSGPDAGKDRVYVTIRFAFAQEGATANLALTGFVIDDAGKAAEVATIALAMRPAQRTAGLFSRVAAHTDGTVYVAHYAVFDATGPNAFDSANLVVLRDDQWGMGPAPFQALIDPDDLQQGVRVVKGINDDPPVDLASMHKLNDTYLDLDSAYALALAIDPNDSATVYVCWADLDGITETVHIRKSTDRGATWSGDVRSIRNATDGTIAIDENGRLGFFYQHVVGRAPGHQRWRYVFEMTDDDFVTITTHVLADMPYLPQTVHDPAERPFPGNLGRLTALGTTFYGGFWALNTPDHTHFPSGVIYQRHADWTKKVLQDAKGKTVPPAVDPFFFRVVQGTKSMVADIKEKSEIYDFKLVKLESAEKGLLPYETGRVDEGWQEAVRYEGEAVRAIAKRVDELEQQLATARAFIEAHERPDLKAPKREPPAPKAGNDRSGDDE